MSDARFTVRPLPAIQTCPSKMRSDGVTARAIATYPSGFGGLYGDGRYPDNTISNPRTYNTLR